MADFPLDLKARSKGLFSNYWAASVLVAVVIKCHQSFSNECMSYTNFLVHYIN